MPLCSSDLGFVSKADLPPFHVLSQRTFLQGQKRPVFARIIASREKANFDYRMKSIGEILMREALASNIRVTRRASIELVDTIQSAKEAAAKLNERVGRFEIYSFLKCIYRMYMRWKDRRVARPSARLMAHELSITRRKGTSPMRVLIEATFPGADLRQKSRWVRALEYLASEDVPIREFKRFIRANGGLAGCARLAAQANGKRRRPGGDWND
jgi:hypothetical protein